MRKPMLLVPLLLALLITGVPIFPAAAQPYQDPNGVYYKQARVFGKVVTFDPQRNLAVIFGSIYVYEPNSGWQLVDSRKFHLVAPVNYQIGDGLAGAINKTVAVEGPYQAWPGQKEEVIEAHKVEITDYPIETPPWYAFGKTVTTDHIVKFNLSQATDLVDVLAGLREAAGIPQDRRLAPGEVAKIAGAITSPTDDAGRSLATRMQAELAKAWNDKWVVTKDNAAANDLRAGVGGWQFYEGLLGYNNSYIEKAPLVRNNLDSFMEVIHPGSGTPEEEGPAAMYALVQAERDKYGKIIKVTVSGALMDTVPGLLQAIADPSSAHIETWRLEGWTEKEAAEMDGRYCWLSGSRVLVRDEKGNLKDQYFSLRNYLTREGFNNTLDITRDVIGEGGVF
ncbi:hypothetical protein MGLY_27560 [Neomoorella glycerini]|uniref:Uncharacterized protein n=1 Tax=Neomoorella glycerini TaxID=55779 RepID=A0A6I5ZUP2_9FIRM|nr:hypothetical protein [Moorella glycerini]QGP93349.1 hypothetical protein MGLY_27560 [Moorella glycerini]